MSEIVGPGQPCPYCGACYGMHEPGCQAVAIERERRNQPRRFRVPCGPTGHPNGSTAAYRHGCYFPLTDLVVSDMGQRGTGEPKGVEWLD